MWVKICANTNLEDTLLAAQLGADAVGFVFAPSKRQVTAARVAAITPHLPPTFERIGVFATSDPTKIADTTRSANLTAIQLHGGLNLSLADELATRLGPAISIIHTLHWDVAGGPAGRDLIAQQLQQIAAHSPHARVLLDAKVGTASGGTGISFDWNQARAVFASQPTLRLIVAGGLTPANVAEAIRSLTPFGVDVASGVELSPGKKDPAKLAQFIANARAAASQ
jgi:phosphoribosylanthranilate isomerase